MARVFLNRDALSRFGRGLLLASCVALAPVASHATTSCTSAGEINAGAAVSGVSGPICNGSDASLSTTNSSVTLMYLGSSAADTDVLSLTGANPGGTIFNNQTTVAGALATLSVTPGTLDFVFTNTNTGDSYAAGQAYTNTGESGPVYHFAEFTYSSEAAFDAGALAKSIPGYEMSSAENSYILSHGGYSAWVFVGLEDLNGAATDDWNDFIFAFDPPATSVPEPATLALLGVGLAGASRLRRRKTK